MELLALPDEAPRRLLLAFSGGRDSTVLLHRLATATKGVWTHLRAVHVDHGLHPGSASWARHCADVAAALGVPLAVHRVDVEREGKGLEAAARDARWRAFAGESRDDECLVLAHHRDDQAETLLLALLRGSGERGLSAMRPYRRDARGAVWRPLLATPASDIARYAESHALRFIDDPSNADLRLSRNALRHELLPLLRARFRQADASLAHSAAALAEADALLDAQARRDLAPLLGLDPNVLDLDRLHALHDREPARAVRALRCWGDTNRVDFSRDAIERVFGDWRALPRTRALRHALGAHWLRQWQGRLWLTPRIDERIGDAGRSAVDAPALARRPWDGRTPFPLDSGATLALLGRSDFDELAGVPTPLNVGARIHARGGLRAHPRRPSKLLQQVFADLGVPPWQRDSVPLLLDHEGRVLAVADLAYEAGFDAWLRSHGARLLWRRAAVHGPLAARG